MVARVLLNCAVALSTLKRPLNGVLASQAEHLQLDIRVVGCDERQIVLSDSSSLSRPRNPSGGPVLQFDFRLGFVECLAEIRRLGKGRHLRKRLPPVECLWV
jgi:hypothetical protein